MKKVIFILFLCTLGVSTLYAQDEGNPFARYGYKAQGSTTIMGRSVLHDRQKIVAIGSVLFDAKADSIAGDFTPDSTVQWLDPQTISMFISDIGRFSTPDPLAEKHYHLSPYAYCANNPIKYIDPDGRDFYVSFYGEGSRDLFERIYNEAFNSQFEVSLKQVGDKNLFYVDIVATEGGGDFSKISDGAHEFYKGIKEVVKAENVVNIAVFNGNSDVGTGNFVTNSIDVGDMHQFENIDNSTTVQNSATRQGKMVHEVYEQYEKNLKGIPRGSGTYQQINAAHEKAVPYENRVNGNERLSDRSAGRDRGVYEFYKKPDGTIVRIRVEGGAHSKPRPIIKLTY